jgi:phosphotriesterase-related protein
VYIGMDRYGLDLFLPMAKRNATVLELLRRGYAEQMFLSQDFDIAIANGLDWFPPEVIEALEAAGAANGWSMTLLFEQVIPELTEQGMSADQLQTMMVESPRRWLGR